MLETLWNSRINVIAVILFAVGLVTLLLHHNLFKKILVLTGIVVSVSVTAVMLALTIRLYQRYHTLDLDEIYMMARQEEKAETAGKEGDAK